MRRAAALAVLAVLLSVAVATAAVAPAPPKRGLHLSGTSAHKRYTVEVVTHCLTPGCHLATEVSIDLTVGTLGQTSGPCPSATDALVGPIVDGRFTATGSFFLAGSKMAKFSIGGRFTGARRITGRIVGPRACGGADDFVAQPS
jgi:hypothetical protein